jgi:hypothetical protein
MRNHLVFVLVWFPAIRGAEGERVFLNAEAEEGKSGGWWVGEPD